MKNLATLILLLFSQIISAQFGLDFPFEIVKIEYNGQDFLDIRDDISIEIYSVSKSDIVNETFLTPVHFNNLIHENSAIEGYNIGREWRLAIPDYAKINWKEYKYIVIEIYLLKIGKTKASTMQILIDLKDFPKGEHLEISKLDFRRGYFKIENLNMQDFRTKHKLDLKNEIQKMSRKEIKNYFDLKRNWKYL